MKHLKNLILILVLGAFHSSKGQTSTYHSFPESGAVWNLHFSLICSEWEIGDIDYSIVTAGDTIIEDVNYTILKTPSANDYSTGNCSDSMVGYKGAIRHDIENKSVYIVPPNQTEEQLLYDFNLEVGDTITGYLAIGWEGIVVESIDSVLVGSSYRKRWIIGTWDQVQIIEGLGSIFGLLESVGKIWDGPIYSLDCFMLDGETLYPLPANPCQAITITKETQASREFRAYPNPTEGNFRIDGSSLSKIARVKVYNSIGVLVSDKQAFYPETTIFNLPETTGLYHIQFMLEDGTTSFVKVVKE